MKKITVFILLTVLTLTNFISLSAQTISDKTVSAKFTAADFAIDLTEFARRGQIRRTGILKGNTQT